MGEAIHCEMQIRTPATWSNDVDRPPWFVQKFYDDLYDFPQIDGFFVDQEIHGWLLSGSLNYGSSSDEAAEAMEIMRELRVPFIFTEEGGPEWPGTMEINTATDSIHRTIDEAGNDVLDKGTWTRLRNQHIGEALGISDAIRLVAALDDWWAEAVVSLSDLTVDHLPVFCPPDPEGRLQVDDTINEMLQEWATRVEQHLLYGRPA